MLNEVGWTLQKLQDDLQELGLKIKHHEENVKYLMTLKSNLDGSIVDMQGLSLSKFCLVLLLLVSF